MITLKNLPINIAESERLKQFEEKPGEKREKQAIIVKPAYVERHNKDGNGSGSNGAGIEVHHHKKKSIDAFNGDDTKANLMNGIGKVHPSPEGLKPLSNNGLIQTTQMN